MEESLSAQLLEKKSIREGSMQLQRRERAPSPTRKKNVASKCGIRIHRFLSRSGRAKQNRPRRKPRWRWGVGPRGATLMDGKPGAGGEKPAGAGARGERG